MRFSLRKKVKFPLGAALSLLLAAFFLFFFYFTGEHMKASLFAIAEIKAKNLAAQAIQDVVQEEMNGYKNQEDLLKVKLDAQGRVSFIQPNTIEVNKLSAGLVLKVQNILQGLTAENIDIPLGQLAGTPLLAGTGPPIRVKVLPMGTVTVRLINDFTDAGINQTKHSIGLSVTANMKIAAPLMSREMEVTAVVSVAEYIIVGQTPDTYVHLPGRE